MKKMIMTIKEALIWAKKELGRAKIKTSALDAEVLLSFILKKPREWIYLNLKFSPNSSPRFRTLANGYKKLIARRKKHEPVAYITRNKEFYGLDFYVDRNVLIPRPETEILVEQALKTIDNLKLTTDKITIADVGTGLGNIAVSLAKNIKGNCKIYATDISEKILKMAKKNAKKHKVSKKIKFLKGSFLNPLKEKVDIVVSNPPYVPKSDKVSREVKYEPKNSVFMPDKNFQEKLIYQINEKLKTGGLAFLEIGKGQKKKIENLVKKIMPRAKTEFIKDYSGIYRVAKILKIND